MLHGSINEVSLLIDNILPDLKKALAQRQTRLDVDDSESLA